MTLTAALAGTAGAVAGAVIGPWVVAAALRLDGARRGPWRSTVLSVVAALLLGALGARLAGHSRERWALPAVLFLAVVGLLLVVIDLETRRLPDVITLPAYPVTGVLLAAASGLAADWAALSRAAVAGVAALALYGALSLAAPHGLGFGDVKLAGLLGLVLGWFSWGVLMIGLTLGFLYGAAVSLLLIALGRASVKTELPFGPAMLAGAFTAVLAGDQIAAWYVSW